MTALNQFCAVKVIAESSHGDLAAHLIALLDMAEEKDWAQVQALAESIRYRAEIAEMVEDCGETLRALPTERLAKGRKCN